MQEKKEKHKKHKRHKKHEKHKKHKKKHSKRHDSSSSRSSSSSSDTESPRRTEALAPLPPQEQAFADKSRVVDGRTANRTSSRIVPGRYKLFVGSLAWTTTEETLRPLFGKFGACECRLVYERDDPTRSR